jgi:hypothetical protein
MDELIEPFLNKIEIYYFKNIDITDYCKEKMQQRNIEESLMISTLFSKSLCGVEEQQKNYRGKAEKRYKLIFLISSKYHLVIIVIFYPKVLKVINCYKTSKRLEKLWKNR